MAKANKKSLDAKAYINAQVNEMREKINKDPDEEARKQLVENFRETTSSDEYKENLTVVQNDTDTIRKDAKRKKWWDITSEEFKDAKTEFYGKNMNLEFWEDFEKLDLGKKVDYIFEKFGDTDYAADLIMNLIISPIKDYGSSCWIDLTMGIQYSYKNKIMKLIFGETNTEILAKNKDRYFKIKNKFWSWPVALRLSLFMLDEFNKHYWDIGMQEAFYEDRNTKKNVTEKTLKAFLEWSDGAKNVAKYCLWIKE